jgi:hypothetical protein
MTDDELPLSWDDKGYANKKCQLIDAQMEMHIDPFEPCQFPPGSPQKVAAMAARFSVGMSLWNFGDADHSSILRIVVDEEH